jgi:acyl carrier protein
VTLSRSEIQAKVVAIVAEALDHRPEDVAAHSSLIDDLGAESIDFLDIAFRVESAFDIEIPDDEIWMGTVGKKDASPEEVETAVRTLRERMPEYRWDRLPERPGRADLPRLITIGTIVQYLERRLQAT